MSFGFQHEITGTQSIISNKSVRAILVTGGGVKSILIDFYKLQDSFNVVGSNFKSSFRHFWEKQFAF